LFPGGEPKRDEHRVIDRQVPREAQEPDTGQQHRVERQPYDPMQLKLSFDGEPSYLP